jgi:hypothetical protein
MSKIEQLIKDYSKTFASILPFNFYYNNFLRLDLSINNLELAKIKELNTDNLSNYINKKLKSFFL